MGHFTEVEKLEEWRMSLDEPLRWEQDPAPGEPKQLWSEEDEAATFAKAYGIGA